MHEIIPVDLSPDEENRLNLKGEMDYLTYRNLCIKQLILQRKMSYEQIGAQSFPPLANNSITRIAESFGIKQRKYTYRLVPGWTKEDDQFLIENYDKMGNNELQYKLKRDGTSIRVRAQALGLTRQNQNIKRYSWRDEQIEYLKKNYATTPFRKMEGDLRKHHTSIKEMAQKLGLKRER